MHEPSVARQLMGAELWARPTPDPTAPPGDPATQPQFMAGWEDGSSFCSTVCSTDVGLAFCRRCPAALVGSVLETGRAGSWPCPAGVRLLAFPAPHGDRDQVAVLRVAPPAPHTAATVAEIVRVAPDVLRRAARDAEPADGRMTLAAARVLRSPAGLLGWQVEQRGGGADRRRTATAALAQMISTSEEFHELYRSSRRQRAELERNQRRLDQLARETLRAKDEERARIAHQIHDTAAQSMVSAFRFLEAARASSNGAAGNGAAGGSGGSVDAHLAQAAERLVTAIAEVRAVLNSLMPPGLEELGLADALRVRLAELTTGTQTDALLAGDLPRLAAHIEQALYGMIAEAVSNAVRHADSRTIRVDLAVRRGRAVLTVRDDGAGFDTAAQTGRSARGGLGLLGISRQATWLGGRATIRSRPGEGTEVRISVPIARHLVPAARGGGVRGTRPDGRLVRVADRSGRMTRAAVSSEGS